MPEAESQPLCSAIFHTISYVPDLRESNLPSIFPGLIRRVRKLPLPGILLWIDNKNVEEDRDQSKYVLVVDDEPEVVSIVASILATKGYKVLTAHGAMEALEKSRGLESE